MPSGRTSRPALQAHDLLGTLPTCSGRRQNHPCRRHHECKPGDQTKDDADKEPRNSGIRLLPRVSDGKALLRPRKKDFRLRKPVISDLLHPLTRDPTVLTASRQRAAPEGNHVMAECCPVGVLKP